MTEATRGSRHLEQLNTEAVRTELDGIPCYWAEVDGPLQAALIFRVGRADETLAGSGSTHLVEHLALFNVGLRRSQFGGFVDQTRSVFHATGSTDEVSRFLTEVAAAVGSLPLERLELEKQVLRTEAASYAGGSLARLMALRYGAAGHGLVDFEELGLRRIGPDDVAHWARTHFTRENAAIWISAPPPQNLELALPAGSRHAPPEPAPLALLEPPAHCAYGRGGVAASFVGERSAALTTLLALLEERVHRTLRVDGGLTYNVAATYMPLTATLAHATLGADCLDEHASLVCDGIQSELLRLAADGPEARELEAVVDEQRRGFEETSFALAMLDSSASAELFGAPITSRTDLVGELEELTPESLARAASDVQSTALMLAPEGVPPRKGFHEYRVSERAALEGRGFRRRGRRHWSPRRRSRIVLAPEGISLMPANGEEDPVTVRFADVAAVLRLGPGRMTLVGLDGSWVRLDLVSLIGGDKVRAALEESLLPELFIPYDEEPGMNVLDLARDKLGYRTMVAPELQALPASLLPGERVVSLAQVQRKFQRGLLVLTDRRLLYLSGGFTGRGSHSEEFPLDEVTRVGWSWLCTFLQRIVFRCGGRKTRFTNVSPAARATEFVHALREHVEQPRRA